MVEAQAPGKPLEPAVVAGFVEGLARQGNWDRANEEMRKAALPDPLAALVAIAAVAVDSRDPGRAKSVLEQAFPAAMNNSRLHEISPWLLYRLVRLGAEVDMEAEALTLAKQIAAVIGFGGDKLCRGADLAEKIVAAEIFHKILSVRRDAEWNA